MPTILITGAASGLGNGFMKFYASNPDFTIIAIDRNTVKPPPASEDVKGTTSTKIITRRLDLTNEQEVSTWALEMGSAAYQIDLVIHSAGVRGLDPNTETTDASTVSAAETVEAIDTSLLLRTLEVNTVATFGLYKALLPLLAPSAKIITMSSRMGSIAHNSTGGGYAYRASKAALNAIIKSLSIDFPQHIWLSLHPGRVETGLTKGREEGAFEVDEVVVEMADSIGRLGSGDSGRFVDRWGKDIGW